MTGSEDEGFGVSVVEAMAGGLVVICRDMVPLNSFVQHGSSRWLLQFDGGTADLERLALLLSCSPAKAAMISSAARQAPSAYDWEEAVPKFVGHYRDALSGHTTTCRPDAPASGLNPTK